MRHKAKSTRRLTEFLLIYGISVLIMGYAFYRAIEWGLEFSTR